MYQFKLSGENVELSKKELLVMLKIKKYKIKDNVLEANIPKLLSKVNRLAFTKKIYKDGKKIWENKEKFGLRRAHLRPCLSPVSLSPKLARCLVNISGADEEIYDPFCGTGGILIEAGLMGLKCHGSDIDEEMLKKCKINLKHYEIKYFKLEKKDATKIRKKYGYIITDLPYGLNTKKQDFDKLYLNFLKNLKRILKNRAVVVFPNKTDYKKMIVSAGLKIEGEFEYYIHKSLTKKIVIIESEFEV